MELRCRAFDGELELRPQDELRDFLDRQSAFYKNQLTPKTPWMAGKMTPDVLKKDDASDRAVPHEGHRCIWHMEVKSK